GGAKYKREEETRAGDEAFPGRARSARAGIHLLECALGQMGPGYRCARPGHESMWHTHGNLLQPYILREIVVGATLALKLPADRGRVVAAAEHLGEKPLLCRPAGIGLRLAIAARHGVIEPAVRGVLVDVNVVALLVPLEAVAKAPNVIERDDVIRFTKSAEHRAGQCRDDVVERFRLQLIDLPFALRGGAIPDDSGADPHFRLEH